jgi:phenylacetate-CoA ligase
VIDLYSLTETGPIACWGPQGDGYRVLPNDIFVEALDPQGRQVPEGGRGEIAVTGGRNPFLPLLRYRTGDWGRIEHGQDKSGRPVVRIMDLEGRRPVLFRAADGGIVNPVDVSRVLREFPFVQHEFVQHADRSCELTVRPIPGTQPPGQEIAAALGTLFGPSIALAIHFDPSLGDRASGAKVTPYRSELLLEE